MTLRKINVVFLSVCSFFFISCSNSLYDAVKEETAAMCAADVEVSESRPCIDRFSNLIIKFDKSMDVSSLSMSGSLAESKSSITWSTRNNKNDTLSLCTSSGWQADSKLSSCTGSLVLQVKDTDGWNAKNFTWTPDILDGIVYVSTTGVDKDSAAGSSVHPFASLMYAMRAINALYPSTAATIKMTKGSFFCYTDYSASHSLQINSPLTIKGGYPLDSWDEQTDIQTIINSTYGVGFFSTIFISGNVDVELNNLNVGAASGYFTIGDTMLSQTTALYIQQEANVKTIDCSFSNSVSTDNDNIFIVFISDNCELTMEDSDVALIDKGGRINIAVFVASETGVLKIKNSDISVGHTSLSGYTGSEAVYAIFNEGKTDINNSLISFSASTTALQVAVQNQTNSLCISNSVINVTQSYETEDDTKLVCVFNSEGSTAELKNTTISCKTKANGGYAVDNYYGTLNVEECDVSVEQTTSTDYLSIAKSIYGIFSVAKDESKTEILNNNITISANNKNENSVVYLSSVKQSKISENKIYVSAKNSSESQNGIYLYKCTDADIESNTVYSKSCIDFNGINNFYSTGTSVLSNIFYLTNADLSSTSEQLLCCVYLFGSSSIKSIISNCNNNIFIGDNDKTSICSWGCYCISSTITNLNNNQFADLTYLYKDKTLDTTYFPADISTLNSCDFAESNVYYDDPSSIQGL